MPVERVAALASVNADAAAVASALGLPPADELPLVDSWPQHSPNPTFGKVWRIPFPIDPDFVGRDQEMTACLLRWPRFPDCYHSGHLRTWRNRENSAGCPRSTRDREQVSNYMVD